MTLAEHADGLLDDDSRGEGVFELADRVPQPVELTGRGTVALALRPGQVGAVSAAISVIGMIGMGFPALAGIVADSQGLAAALGLYAAVPMVILALIVLARR